MQQTQFERVRGTIQENISVSRKDSYTSLRIAEKVDGNRIEQTGEVRNYARKGKNLSSTDSWSH